MSKRSRAKRKLLRLPVKRINSPHSPRRRNLKRNAFTARLTIDVSPDLRARIKITAFERGVTVAYMLRRLLLSAFPRRKGKKS